MVPHQLGNQSDDPGLAMSDWAVEPHDEIPELDPDYQPVRSHWATLQDKLDHATYAQLRELMNMGTGEPDARQ